MSSDFCEVVSRGGQGFPMLLFHGQDDDTVPFSSSERLAELAGDRIGFVPYLGNHVRAWNVDPDAYRAEVTDFLARMG